MIKRFNFTVFLCFFLKTITLQAQQDALYSQYMFNQLIYNPAYAGIKGGISINGFMRNQWVGIDDAPKTKTLSADMLMPDGKSAMGAYFIQDAIGPQKNTSFFINYDYWLSLNENNRLSFGIAGGLTQTILDGTKLRALDNSDTFVPSDVQRRLYPDAAAGLYLTNDSYYAGISITHIIRSVNKTRNNVIPTDRHYYATAGYVATLNEVLKLYPSVLLKTDLRTPLQYDISSMFLIKEMVWIGASYRNSFKKSHINYVAGGNDNVLTMLARITILERYQVGYAYDYGRSALASSGGGTHEISFSTFFNSGKIRGEGPKCYF